MSYLSRASPGTGFGVRGYGFYLLALAPHLSYLRGKWGKWDKYNNINYLYFYRSGAEVGLAGQEGVFRQTRTRTVEK